jgi:CBS domain-containing protein
MQTQARVPMTRNVTVAPPELPLPAAWRIMERLDVRHLPIVRAGALFGILSDRDVLLHSTREESGVLRVPEIAVAEVMSSELVTCEADTSVSELARIMTQRKVDAIPIVRGLKLVGLVTSTDLMALLIDEERVSPPPFDFRILDTEGAALLA